MVEPVESEHFEFYTPGSEKVTLTRYSEEMVKYVCIIQILVLVLTVFIKMDRIKLAFYQVLYNSLLC